jgi:hypothetical protein
MKQKILLVVIALFIKTFGAFSQDKYAFIIVAPYGKKVEIFSGLINLSKLNVSSISKKNEYGTEKSKMDVYSEYLTLWYKKHLKSVGQDKYLDGYENITVWTFDRNDQYINCPTGNEDGCFMNHDIAEKARNNFMTKIKGTPFYNTVLEIE